MKDEIYWKQFVNTGRVEDYLHYRINADGTATGGGSAQNHEGASSAASCRLYDTERKRGVVANAGMRGSDRDHFEG